MLKVGDRIVCKTNIQKYFNNSRFGFIDEEIKVGGIYIIDCIDSDYQIFSVSVFKTKFFIATYDNYFYTDKELRKMKLERINNESRR